MRFLYRIPLKNGTKVQYYKDIKIKSLSKSYIIDEDGYLSETVEFDCLSLWYEENTAIYKVTPQNDEIRWDFQWDSRFADYDTRSLTYINKGHVEAPVLISIDGHIINPVLSLYVEGELVQEVKFTVEINEYEKFLYGTKENDFYVKRQKTDGTDESLFNLDVLPNFQTVDEVIRLPKNKNCELKLTADNEILNAQITILPQYKAV